jgi:hypothetical protein
MSLRHAAHDAAHGHGPTVQRAREAAPKDAHERLKRI